MVAAFLQGGDAARVFALDHIDQPLGLLRADLFADGAVLDDGDGDLRIQIPQNIKVQAGHVTLDLDDILLAGFLAAHVLQQRHAGIVQLFQLHHMVQRKPRACGDVVNDHAVLNFVNVQHSSTASPVLGSFRPSNVIISAIRIYTPFCTCSK